MKRLPKWGQKGRDPEKVKAHKRSYYRKNRSKVLAQQSLYRASIPEKRREWGRNWFRRHGRTEDQKSAHALNQRVISARNTSKINESYCNKLLRAEGITHPTAHRSISFAMFPAGKKALTAA